MLEKRRMLLVVDDDDMVRESVVAYLEDSGFDVIQANQGVVGLELFYEHNPDLVLTDLRMPEMDGIQLLDKVHEETQDVPVIVISGVGVMGDVVEALRLGAADYLIKPLLDMEVLIHAVNRSLECRDLIAQNETYRYELEETNLALRDNLQILQRDQQAGRQVQQQLLPQSPFRLSQYTVEHKVIPSLFLSGDFIDLKVQDNRYLFFYLVDVSGHGASSAFATIWLKHVARELIDSRTMAGQHVANKAQGASISNIFLERVNTELLASSLEHHMTCFTGVIDTYFDKLYYSIAGHLPLPVLYSNNEVRYLEGKGCPLGIFPQQDWPLYEVDFPAGASLVGFSDGILELMPSTDLLEKEALLLQYLSNSDGSLESVFNTLMLNRLDSAPDDIAIMCINREAK
jgi:sigma-B regulation protein RsbU (phosphoserine phosphatase)